MEQFEVVRVHLSRHCQQQPQGSRLDILQELTQLRSQLRSAHPEAMRHLLHYCQGNALTLDQALQTAYCDLHLSLPFLPLRS